MNLFGPVHTLTVTTPVEGDEEAAYTITHPAECAFDVADSGVTVYDCAVAHNAEGTGLLWTLGVEGWHEGYRHLAPGEYPIQAWQTKYDVPGEPVEYDGGVTVLEETPQLLDTTNAAR